MATWIDDHRLEQASIGLLNLPTPVKLRLGGPKPNRERIAHPLQLTDAQHPRAADGANAPLDPGAGKCRREQLAQLALQGADLTAKLGAPAPRAALVRALLAKQRVESLGRRRRFRHLDLEQFVGHEVSLRSRRPIYSSPAGARIRAHVDRSTSRIEAG